jgi:hypothetical protein
VNRFQPGAGAKELRNILESDGFVVKGCYGEVSYTCVIACFQYHL